MAVLISMKRIGWWVFGVVLAVLAVSVGTLSAQSPMEFVLDPLGNELVGGQDSIGISVSLSADGRTMAVGAQGVRNVAGREVTHVSLFRLDDSDVWQPLGERVSGLAELDGFGRSVALSADGNTFAASAPSSGPDGNRPGDVRVFSLDGSGEWQQVGNTVAGRGGFDRFGSQLSLSADGRTFVASANRNDAGEFVAGHARVYSLDGTGEWTQVGDSLGGDTNPIDPGGPVSISADGETVAVGAVLVFGDQEVAGRVEVFSLSGGEWVQVGSSLERLRSDFFGEALSLSADGNTLAIGSRSHGERTRDVFPDMPARAISDDCCFGQVEVFAFAGSDWALIGSPIEGTQHFDMLGDAVSLSDDGRSLVIGGDDVAAVFRLEGQQWLQVGERIDDADDEFDGTGFAVAISGDASTVAITSPFGGTVFPSPFGTFIPAGRVRTFSLEPASLVCAGRRVTVDVGSGQSPTSGDDVILGTEGADVIDGLAGNDVICGLGGNDRLSGGAGEDEIHGAAGADVIVGGSGADLLLGNGGDDTISGRGGDDIVFGNEGDDLLLGGSGNDGLDGGRGNDAIQGGVGADLVLGREGADVVDAGSGDDDVYGGDGGDTILGRGGDDDLFGEEGDDRIVGGDGDDSLDGGIGNDELRGGLGDDGITGEAGNDELYGGQGRDGLVGGSGVDRLLGGRGGDFLSGGEGNDVLFGGATRDHLAGNDGDDVINGGAGRDDLFGAEGNDVLNGGEGRDRLNGGPGRDDIDAGPGPDRIAGDSEDVIVDSPGDDVVFGVEAAG